MRWLLVLLTAAGLVVGYLVWRSVAEPSRRYGVLLEEAARFGLQREGPASEHLRWFLARDPEGLARRVRASILSDGHHEAGTRLLQFLGLAYLQRGQFVRGADPEEEIYAAGKRVLDLVFEGGAVLAALAGGPSARARRALISLLRFHPEARVAWEAVLRLAERDPDREVRLAAVEFIEAGSRRSPFPWWDVVDRLTRDPDAAVRLAALCVLGGHGNPQAAREGFLLALQSDEVPQHEREGQMIQLGRRLIDPALREEVVRFAVQGGCRIDGASWERAERLGNVLERRRLGEFDPEPR